MGDNEFTALMLGRVLKRDNGDTGLMIKFDGMGGMTERLYNVATGRTINTRRVDHVDIATLEMNNWQILPETTPLQ